MAVCWFVAVACCKVYAPRPWSAFALSSCEVLRWLTCATGKRLLQLAAAVRVAHLQLSQRAHGSHPVCSATCLCHSPRLWWLQPAGSTGQQLWIGGRATLSYSGWNVMVHELFWHGDRRWTKHAALHPTGTSQAKHLRGPSLFAQVFAALEVLPRQPILALLLCQETAEPCMLSLHLRVLA